MTPNAVLVGYMIIAIALAAIVHALPALDLRGVGRMRARSAPEAGADAEIDYEPRARAHRAERRRAAQAAAEEAALPRADLAVLIATFGALGVALGAAIGFLGPRFLETAFAAGESETAEFVWTADAPLARAAQMIGAVAFGLIALRMLRIFMALAIFAALALTAHIAVAYTLGRPIWEPIGLAPPCGF